MTYAIKSLLQSASNCRLSGDMPYACKEKRMKIVIGSPRQHVLIKKIYLSKNPTFESIHAMLKSHGSNVYLFLLKVQILLRNIKGPLTEV